ncbi:MAG TPA: prepilin-type N-terminal cleavage/methylation domain-containing protein, partial [Phycisphaerae bacterium]|nr:prepilin-type N-terminal cleavage/methylation domain-containing protein [Phycisphaerae bacterium]
MITRSKKMRNRKTGRAGLTLIEVLLVLVILAGLGTIAVVALSGTKEGAKISETEIRLKKLLGIIERYSGELGYPTEEQGGLDALVTKPEFENETMGDKWFGPYAKREDLKDSWGNPVHYEVVEDDSSGRMIDVVKLTSDGPD